VEREWISQYLSQAEESKLTAYRFHFPTQALQEPFQLLENPATAVKPPLQSIGRKSGILEHASYL